MPNWVYNTLEISADTETIAKIKNQLNASYSIMIENKITTYNNPVIAFWNITKPSDLEAYGKQAEITGTTQPLGFKGHDWYNWNNNNWGTKWDIAVSDEGYDATRISVDEETLLAYEFQTAWSPPLPVIRDLSIQYPEAEINLSYEEEQGWGGEIQFNNGEHTQIREYDIPSSHAEMIERRGECYCEPPDFPFDDCVVKK